MTPATFTAARQSLGLTQQALADHLGRSRRIVQLWESGGQPVDALAARYMTALLSGYRPSDWPGTAHALLTEAYWCASNTCALLSGYRPADWPG